MGEKKQTGLMAGLEAFCALQEKAQVEKILEKNRETERFGLSLSEGEAQLLLAERGNTLKKEQRVEFGDSILPEIIEIFCDSAYITQDNYCETLTRIQEIFFLYKNEMLDEITDGELLEFMKEQWEGVCYGDLDYLEGTCLDLFAQAIRAGYSGFEKSGGRGEFGKFDIVTRWDRGLYLAALQDLF